MPTDTALLHDRLSELVACLSGSPEMVVRNVVEQSMNEDSQADALRHVAAALVKLRRCDQRRRVHSLA